MNKYSILNYQLIYYSNASLICRAHTLSIGAQRLGHHTLTLQWLLRTGSQLLVGEAHVDAAVRDVYFDDVTIFYLSDIILTTFIKQTLRRYDPAHTSTNSDLLD